MGTSQTLVQLTFNRRWHRAQALLAEGCSRDQLTARDSYGATALHYATMGEQAELCQQLIDAGARLDAADNHGRTPLHSAAYGGRVGICKLLIAAGAPLAARDGEGDTVYHYGAKHGEVLTTLLEAGFDVSLANPGAIQPIHLVGQAGCQARVILEMLLLRGADPRARTRKLWTPLLFSAHRQKCTPQLIKDLVAAGAQLTDSDDEGNTAAHLFALLGRLDLLESLLVGARAQLRARALVAETLQGAQALHFAARGDSCTCILFFLNEGCPIDRGDARGWTPLHYAAHHGQAKAVELLLEHGADAWQRAKRDDGACRTPIEVAKPGVVARLRAAMHSSDRVARNYQQRDATYARAHKHFVDKQRKPARSELRRVLEIDPTFAPATALIGELQHQAGDLKSARLYLQRALALDPSRPEVHCALGFVAADRRRFARAREHYTEALKHDPGYLLARVRRAYVHVQENQPEAALRDYRAYLAGGGGTQFGDTKAVEAAIQAIQAGSLSKTHS